MSNIKLKTPDGSNDVTLSAANGGDVVVTLPKASIDLSTAGSDGQFLKTDGAGTLSFADVSSVGGATGVDFNDTVKARWGTGNDLEIHHTSNNSTIKNGTGSLYLNSDVIELNNAAASETMIQAEADGAVKLFYNGVQVCLTSADGLKMIEGKGIDFSATDDAGTTGSSMTSELLDWYEEGSWTPSITFGGTSNFVGGPHNVQWGTYTRVGRLVTASGTIGYSAKGSSSGLVNINGLPFTSGGSTHRCGGWANYSNFFSNETDNSTVQLYLGDSRTNMETLHDSQDNLNASDCNASGQMNFTVLYQV